MVTIENRDWRIQWDEQDDKLTILPPYDSVDGRTITLSGRQYKNMVELIASAMRIPQGDNRY